MKLTLLLVAGLIAAASSAYQPSNARVGLGGVLDEPDLKLVKVASEEQQIGLPPQAELQALIQKIVSPQMVRGAIQKAVDAARIPPPVNGWISNAAANQAIKAMKLEDKLATGAPGEQGMEWSAKNVEDVKGKLIQAAQRMAMQAASVAAGKAAEMAVTGSLTNVVGPGTAGWVGKIVGIQVIKTLGGKIADQNDTGDDDQMKNWLEFVKSKTG